MGDLLARMRNAYQPGQCPTCGALPGHQRPDADPETEERP